METSANKMNTQSESEGSRKKSIKVLHFVKKAANESYKKKRSYIATSTTGEVPITSQKKINVKPPDSRNKQEKGDDTVWDF